MGEGEFDMSDIYEDRDQWRRELFQNALTAYLGGRELIDDRTEEMKKYMTLEEEINNASEWLDTVDRPKLF